MSDLHPNETTAVSIHEAAPDFTLLNTDGEPYTLSQATAVSPVILIFYRGDW